MSGWLQRFLRRDDVKLEAQASAQVADVSEHLTEQAKRRIAARKRLAAVDRAYAAYTKGQRSTQS